MIYPILLYGDKVLRQESLPVENKIPDGDKIQDIVDGLLETLRSVIGVGLSAPQAGIPLRIFVMRAFSGLDDRGIPSDFVEEVFINPVIENSHEDKEWFHEGCLSFPGIFTRVRRPKEVTVSYRNRKLKKQTKTFSGVLASVVQHEIDHLNGVLFIDHMGSLEKKVFTPKLKQIMRGNNKPKYARK